MRTMLRTFVLHPVPLRLLRNGHAPRQLISPASNCAGSSLVQATKSAQVIAAVPGTVKEYEHHILIQTAPLKSDAAAKECYAVHGCWWPSVVEK